MEDSPMTATEVEQRKADSRKRPFGPTINLGPLIRRVRRAALRAALDGSPQDRFRYCTGRAAERHL